MIYRKILAISILLLIFGFVPFHLVYGQNNPDEYDRFNIRLTWFPLAGGGMDADIRITPKLSVGPSFGGWGCYNDNLDEQGGTCGLSVVQGIRMNYYYHSVSQSGLYFSPGIYRTKRKLEYSHNEEVYDGSFARASVSAMAGYMFQWNMGVNIKLGMGGATILGQPANLEVTSPEGDAMIISPDSPTQLLVEVSFGFSF